jgi:LysR family transcriptional regulator, chromosome initiation inhibitor
MRRWHALAGLDRPAHLRDGSLIPLLPDAPLDVPLYRQHARAASTLLDGLSRKLADAAGRALLPA